MIPLPVLTAVLAATGPSVAATFDRSALVASWHVPAQSVAFSPDGAKLGVQSGLKILLLNPRSGRALAQHTVLPGKATTSPGIVFSPDGRFLAGGGLNRVLLVEVARGRLAKTLDPGFPVYALAFSPDSRQLVAGSSQLYVWSVPGGEPQGHPRDIAVTAQSMVFTRDGRRLLLGGFRIAADVVAVDTGTWSGAGSYSRDTSFCDALALSADGRGLASGENGHVVTLWDVELHRLLWRYEDPECCEGQFLAFSPDGRCLVTGTGSGRLLVLDAKLGRVIRKCPMPNDKGFLSAAFSPDGLRLATAGYDGILRIWNFPKLIPGGTSGR